MTNTATAPATVNAVKYRDDYGRSCEKRYLTDPWYDVVHVVTLPWARKRKEEGKPTHLANDWGNRDESAVYFHSLKDARAWADARLRSR